jgi:3'(2'), 5'-bisphosphate nucleotidase
VNEGGDTPPDQLAAEHRDAAVLADMAGRALLELREGPSARTDVGAAGDRLAHQLLVKELNRLYPDDDVRSEEGLEHVSGSGRLWIIDPLDGTREFRQPGRSDWAVHVALAVGGVAVVGAVALPALGLTLSTGAPLPLQPLEEGAPPRVVVSRTRPPEVAYEVADALGGVMIPMGSAGAKIAAVILGAAEVYVHAGGSTSGTPVPRLPWRRRVACTPPGSTVTRCVTGRPTPGYPTWWCAGPSWPKRCST